jgi:hypothetical protein
MMGAELRAELARHAPFKLALFVGLSSWLPKPQTVSHLRWLRGQMETDSTLVTDCFTPDAYALSGRYVGYKASYYTPEVYRVLVDSCGFDGRGAEVESGRDRINQGALRRIAAAHSHAACGTWDLIRSTGRRGRRSSGKWREPRSTSSSSAADYGGVDLPRRGAPRDARGAGRGERLRLGNKRTQLQAHPRRPALHQEPGVPPRLGSPATSATSTSSSTSGW